MKLVPDHENTLSVVPFRVVLNWVRDLFAGPLVTAPELLNCAPCLGQEKLFEPATYSTVTPSCVQAADTAMNDPELVRAIITPLFTRNPPLEASVPLETSTVKSTPLEGPATESSEQEENPPMQTGISKAAAPVPAIEKNSFLEILFITQFVKDISLTTQS